MRRYAALALLLAACGSGGRQHETAVLPASIAVADAGAAAPFAAPKPVTKPDDYRACTVDSWSSGKGCVASTVWSPAEPFRSESASDLEALYAHDNEQTAPRTLTALVAIATTLARDSRSTPDRAMWARRAVSHHDKLVGAGRTSDLDDEKRRQATELAAEAAYLLVELDATTLLPADATLTCPAGTLDELFGKPSVQGARGAATPFWPSFVRKEDKLDERFDQLESKYRYAAWSAMAEARRGLMLDHLRAQLMECDRQLGVKFSLFTPAEDQFLLAMQNSNDPSLVAKAFEVRRATLEYFQAKTKQHLAALIPLEIRHLALGVTLAGAAGVTNAQTEAARRAHACACFRSR